jgi:hypothetical protein
VRDDSGGFGMTDKELAEIFDTINERDIEEYEEIFMEE